MATNGLNGFASGRGDCIKYGIKQQEHELTKFVLTVKARLAQNRRWLQRSQHNPQRLKINVYTLKRGKTMPANKARRRRGRLKINVQNLKARTFAAACCRSVA